MEWIELGWGCRERMAPDFRLPAADGGEVTRSEFRQRRHLVLLFLPDTAAPAAQRLAAAFHGLAPRLARAEGLVYAIAPAPTPLPIPLLLDRDGAVRQRYADFLPDTATPAPDAPFLVILDRFGGLAEVALGELARERVAHEALDWVRGLQHECPE